MSSYQVEWTEISKVNKKLIVEAVDEKKVEELISNDFNTFKSNVINNEYPITEIVGVSIKPVNELKLEEQK